MDQDKNSFEIVGTVDRVSAAKSGKVWYFTVKENGATTKRHDLKFFRAMPGYDRGDRVRVTGHIGYTKVEGVPKQQGRDGKEYDRWFPELIGEACDVLSERQASLPATQAETARPDDDIPF